MPITLSANKLKIMEQNLYLYFTKSDTKMDLRADIKWIKKEIESIDDPTFLEAIKNMLQYRSKVIGGDAIRDTIEEYNRDLDEAIEEIENGEYYTQEEVENIASKW